MPDETLTTVEWGSPAVERAARRRWRPRIGWPRAGPGSAALSCAVVGFALAVAAQLLPWMTVEFGVEGLNQAVPVDIGLDLLVSVPAALVYQLVWPPLLGLVGAALVVARRRRRVVAAAGLGVAAGQVAVLAGLVRAIRYGAGVYSFGPNGVRTANQLPPITLGPGVYFGFAAVLLVALALVFAMGTRLRRGGVPPNEDEPDAGPPPDLTVTPLGPFSADIDVRPHRPGG